jgi:hypothetical protein
METLHLLILRLLRLLLSRCPSSEPSLLLRTTHASLISIFLAFIKPEMHFLLRRSYIDNQVLRGVILVQPKLRLCITS